MNCYYHPDREAVGMCVACGKPVCLVCRAVLGEKFYCNLCANKIFSGKTEIGTTTVENTSGQGSRAVIPKEIRGWNWGAFLGTWVWAIGNNVWIGLLSFIPYAGFIMAIMLGIRGNEWARQNRRWDSVEHFKRTQSTWTKVGIGIFIFFALIGFLIVVCTVGIISHTPL